MPSQLEIIVDRARDLPPMDQNVATEASTDAYVEVKLQTHYKKTNTCRRTLNPIWGEAISFTDIDSRFQDEPLELRCMDHDLYSSELIGVVYIDLNPLIMRARHGTETDVAIDGWFPLFDTAKGLRGSLKVTVKLHYIANDNKYIESSAGIQFFSSSKLSNRCFFVQEILGFVEELVVHDDPENSWQDYFLKGNKVSNDNRMKAAHGLSAEIKRRLGKKVAELGGNAVLGYSFHFDTESTSGIVARAYGTACRLLKVDESSHQTYISRATFNSLTSGIPEWKDLLKYSGKSLLLKKDLAVHFVSKLPKSSGSSKKGFSSDSLVLLKCTDQYSISAIVLNPISVSGEKNDKSRDMLVSRQIKNDILSMEWLNSTNNAENTNIFQGEIQLITMKSFPSHVHVRLGGLVIARAIKYLGKQDATVSDEDTREEWWKELREEIRAHANTLCCRHIIGYSETCTVYGDVYVLSAMGTAAVLKNLSVPISDLPLPNSETESTNFDPSSPSSPLHDMPSHQETFLDTPSARSRLSQNFESFTNSQGKFNKQDGYIAESENNHSHSQYPSSQKADSLKKNRHRGRCSATHVPYNHNTAPFAFMRLVPCLQCKRKWVPESIISTTELPTNVTVAGKGRLLEAKVCRMRKASNGESDAVRISEVLPFVEYDLQRQINLKLKVLGMNAVFGYSCELQIGSDIVIATAVCTAVQLQSLPLPAPLQLQKLREGGRIDHDIRLMNLQKELDNFTLFIRQLHLKNSYTMKKDSSLYVMKAPSEHRGLTWTKSSQDPNEMLQGLSLVADNNADRDDKSDSESSSSSSSSRSSYTTSTIEDSHDESSLESPSSSSSSSSESNSGSSESDADQSGEATEDSKVRKRTISQDSKRSEESFEEANLSSTKRRASIQSKKSAKSSIAGGEPTKKDRKVIYRDERHPYVLEIDNETDADIISVLKDWICPNGVEMVNLVRVPGSKEVILSDGKQISVFRRARLSDSRCNTPGVFRNNLTSGELGNLLNNLFCECYMKLCFNIRSMIPCQILNISHSINILEDNQVELLVTAMVFKVSPRLSRNLRAMSFHDSEASDNYEHPSNRSTGAFWMGKQDAHVSSPSLVGSTFIPVSRERSIQPSSRSQSFDQPLLQDKGNNIVSNSISHVNSARLRGISTSSNDSYAVNYVVDNCNLDDEPFILNSSGTTRNFDFVKSTTSGTINNGKLGTIEEVRNSDETLESIMASPQVKGKTMSTGGSSTSNFVNSGMQLTPPIISRAESAGYSAGFEDANSGMKLGASVSIADLSRPSSTVNTKKLPTYPWTSHLPSVVLTPLHSLPNARIKKYLGPIQLHLVKDAWTIRGDGTLGSYFNLLLSEVNSMARAHVTALGGNALLAYKVSPLESGSKAARTQGYTMFSISGDAVLLEVPVDHHEGESLQPTNLESLNN